MSGYQRWRDSGHVERATETVGGTEAFEEGATRLREAKERRITVTELQRDIDDVFDQVVRGESFTVTRDDGCVVGRLVPPDTTERGRPPGHPRSVLRSYTPSIRAGSADS